DLAAYDAAKTRAEFEADMKREQQAWDKSRAEGKDGGATPLFSLRAEPRMSLMVEQSGFATKRVAVDKIPGGVEVKLDAEAVIEGRVVMVEPDTADSHEAVRPTVTLVRDMQAADNVPPEFGFQITATRVDDKGWYRFDQLPSGKYNIMAKAEKWT